MFLVRLDSRKWAGPVGWIVREMGRFTTRDLASSAGQSPGTSTGFIVVR
jgi:hypothetical protein